MTRRIFSTLARMLLTAVLAATGAWGTFAIAWSGHEGVSFRHYIAAGYAAIALVVMASFFFHRRRWLALTVHAAIFCVLVAWWRGIEPSNDRDWQTDVAVLPYATVDGNLVTMHNIRNFDYRSEFDYTPAYYDRTFDLNALEGIDLVAAYWMGPAIAHTFVSFAFAGGDHLAVSIEARKERDETYSAVKGFFRQNELIYIVADERDVIRLRTNYRHNPIEDVYVYRVRSTIENSRRVFGEYVKKINSLKQRPEFYNSLTANCTTNIWFHSLANPDHVPFSWKILASGYLPEYLHELGRLDTRTAFPELRRQAHVNLRARDADRAADFSQRIR